MNNIEFDIQITKNGNREDEIKAALMELYEVNAEGSTPDFNAVGILAVECGMKLFTALLSVRRPNDGLGFKALWDFSVGLNDNLFWGKHAGRLMPLVHIALSAQADFALLTYEKQTDPNVTVYDKLRNESELVGLEIFVMVCYLLHGPDKTATKSLQIKRTMAPYLVM